MKAKSLANKVLFVLQAKVWLKRKQSKVGPQFKSSCANAERRRNIDKHKSYSPVSVRKKACTKMLNKLELSKELRYFFYIFMVVFALNR